jgi:signal transduction histidine kinase
MADQLANAVENAHLFQQMQARTRELALVNEMSQALSAVQTAEAVFDHIHHYTAQLMDATNLYVALYDPDQDEISFPLYVDGESRRQIRARRMGAGMTEYVIRSRRPLLIAAQVAERCRELGIEAIGQSSHSWLGAPMLVGDQVAGILSVQNLDEENAFNESDVGFLQMFAASISIALENARLYEQAQHLAVLEERQRLARELHDSVTQSLYGISLYAQAAAGNIAAGQVEQARQYIEDIQSTSQESLADMRLLIYELKPPVLEKEGLVAALQNRLNAVENRANIKSKIQSNLTERLPLEMEDGLFQVAREALNNIIKHARAKNVSILLGREADSVSMEISDDGIGFALENAYRNGCMGLANMQERARLQGWNLNIESSPGDGTRVKVEIKQP